VICGRAQVLRVPDSALDRVLDAQRLASGSVSASPVVSVEPRVRKFHQPVTITIPLPQRSHLRLNRANNASSLRLLASMSGTVAFVCKRTKVYQFII